MECRQLGKTGYQASVLTLGGCALGWLHEQEPELAQKKADNAIEKALELGINIVDVAPSYGEAEVRLAPWIEKYRDKIFLAGKTLERNRTGAWSELNKSLERLHASCFDLYQFHAVDTIEEVKQITGKNGALGAIQEALESGLVKNIGITCHSDMQVLLRALGLIEGLSTVLLPVYVAAMVKPHPANDFRPVLKKAREENLGVIAIKAISWRRWTFAKKYATWYQPLDEQVWIDNTVRYTLSQEGVTTYSLPCDLRLWPLVQDSVKRFEKKLDAAEQNEITELAKKNHFVPLFPKDH
ncbi:MAG: aldo/keto reductase [Candidatus Odinarchaeota archaeon]